MQVLNEHKYQDDLFGKFTVEIQLLKSVSISFCYLYWRESIHIYEKDFFDSDFYPLTKICECAMC